MHCLSTPIWYHNNVTNFSGIDYWVSVCVCVCDSPRATGVATGQQTAGLIVRVVLAPVAGPRPGRHVQQTVKK